MVSIYLLGITEKNFVQNKLIKSNCLNRYVYTYNKRSIINNTNKLNKELVKNVDKTNKRYINNSVKKNLYVGKYNLEGNTNPTFKNIPLIKPFSTQKIKFYGFTNKIIKNKKENLLNFTETNNKLPLLKNESDKINELFKILHKNQKKLDFFRYFFLINYFIILLSICSLYAFSENIIDSYIISKIEKLLEDIKKSKEIENNIKEIINSLLYKIVNEEKNINITSLFFIEVLKNSKKEIGNIFIEILETEQVKNKLKSIFNQISIYLCNNKEVQKNCYHLLSEAIQLPAAIASSEKWLVNLFNSNNVKQNIRDIIYKDLFKNEDMINNSISYLQNILYNTLQNKNTQKQTKNFLSSIISNQEFQHQLSENIWKVFKLALSPKWMNNEDFKMEMKESKKNEIKETETNRINTNNIKNATTNNIGNVNTNNSQLDENNINTNDKSNIDKEKLYEDKDLVDTKDIRNEKKKKKKDLIVRESEQDVNESIKSHLNGAIINLSDENKLKKEIKRVIEIYENGKEKINDNTFYIETERNPFQINEVNELINKEIKEKEINLNELMNYELHEKKENKLDNVIYNELKKTEINELSKLMNNEILKESLKHTIETYIILNSLKSLLLSSNINKMKYLDIPIYKIRNFKEINQNFTVSYLNNILKNPNNNDFNNLSEIEKEKYHEGNKLYTYSIEEKIKLAIVDMLLFYSYKYYFYYYYIIKLKLLFQNLLNVKVF